MGRSAESISGLGLFVEFPLEEAYGPTPSLGSGGGGHRAMGAVSATNETSHGRQCFLVVIAASRRSWRRRSSLFPPPTVFDLWLELAPSWWSRTAEVFFTPTQKKRKKSLHIRLPPFYRRNMLGVCASSRHLRRQAHFAEIEEKRRENNEKSHLSTGRGPWAVCGGVCTGGHVVVFDAPPWRSQRSLADTAGGRGGHLRRPTAIFGGLNAI